MAKILGWSPWSFKYRLIMEASGWECGSIQLPKTHGECILHPFGSKFYWRQILISSLHPHHMFIALVCLSYHAHLSRVLIQARCKILMLAEVSMKRKMFFHCYLYVKPVKCNFSKSFQFANLCHCPCLQMRCSQFKDNFPWGPSK